jgi:hypothetical protein
MKLNKVVLSLLAGLTMVLCLSTRAVSKEKTLKTNKSICFSDRCFGTANSDIIIIDPIASKIKNRGLYGDHQEFMAMSVLMYGAKIRSYSSIQLHSENLHILFRQLLL